MESGNPFDDVGSTAGQEKPEKEKKKKKHRSSLASLRSSKDKDRDAEATEPLLEPPPSPSTSPLLKGQVEAISSHRRTSSAAANGGSVPVLNNASFGQVRDVFQQALPSSATKPRSPLVSPRVMEEAVGDLSSDKDYTNRVIYTLLARQMESTREEHFQELEKLGKRLAGSFEFLFQRINLLSYAMADISRGAVYETSSRGDLNPLVQPNPGQLYAGRQPRPPPSDSCCSCFPWC